MKKVKYWQRNGGFKFYLEVKITLLINIFSTVFSNQFLQLTKAAMLPSTLFICLRVAYREALWEELSRPI